MLTKDELDYLSKIPDKKVSIKPFDPKAKKTGDLVVSKIKRALPHLKVLFMGATALRIAGRADIDIYVLANSKDFDKYLPTLKKIFGEPIHYHNTFIEWQISKQEYNIEVYLTDPNSPSTQRQIKIFEILKANKKILKEYEDLKLSFDRKSFRDYQKAKYEFYNRILTKL